MAISNSGSVGRGKAFLPENIKKGKLEKPTGTQKVSLETPVPVQVINFHKNIMAYNK